jgi:hypothetical protein
MLGTGTRIARLKPTVMAQIRTARERKRLEMHASRTREMRLKRHTLSWTRSLGAGEFLAMGSDYGPPLLNPPRTTNDLAPLRLAAHYEPSERPSMLMGFTSNTYPSGSDAKAVGSVVLPIFPVPGSSVIFMPAFLSFSIFCFTSST